MASDSQKTLGDAVPLISQLLSIWADPLVNMLKNMLVDWEVIGLWQRQVHVPTWKYDWRYNIHTNRFHTNTVNKHNIIKSITQVCGQKWRCANKRRVKQESNQSQLTEKVQKKVAMVYYIWGCVRDKKKAKLILCN